MHDFLLNILYSIIFNIAIKKYYSFTDCSGNLFKKFTWEMKFCREMRAVAHNHKAFLDKAKKRKGFKAAYGDLDEEYAVIREMIAARFKSGLTQERVAELMAATKNAVPRLESAGKHAPSLATLEK